MKTATRARIIEIVKKRGTARPIELVKKLGISPQAIHRHLKSLVASGILEIHGRGPMTRYLIAGAPQLNKMRTWYASAEAPAESPADFVCGTRDVFTARLGRLISFTKMGLKEDELPLTISMAGEIGNNSFDHNLGNWRDVPGCWFEAQATGGRLWICIADRGQGVFRSLENRGNGLKFVRNIIIAGAGRGLACRSGSGLVEYGQLGPDCRKELAQFPSQPNGTITLILWSLK